MYVKEFLVSVLDQMIFESILLELNIYIDLAAFGDKVFNGVIKVKWDHVDLTLIQYEWCSYKRD